jgi:nucleotide-binding universal stress UspA family protein
MGSAAENDKSERQGGRAMKIVMSADSTSEGLGARAWCAEHLGPADAVIAVVGINPVGEFVMGVPPFDVMGDEHTVVEQVERDHCHPLRQRGLDCRARVVAHTQANAVLEVAAEEHADLIVVGKRPRGPVGDLVWGEVATHLVHHPPCPIVVVPVVSASSHPAVA